MNLKSLFLLALGVSGAVIEATDKTIDTYLSNNVPMILDLYATWCSHCKQFSPVFDELASEFEHLEDQIQFVKVNVDKNRKTSKRFDLEYIPTIKFIHGDRQEEIDSRDKNSLKQYIKENLGITPSSSPSSKDTEETKPIKKVSRESRESHLLHLVDDTFGDAVDGKHSLIAFTTTWCGYCKMLAPQWAELATLYANDEDIVIANVDCTDTDLTYSLMQTFGVEAFPTIVYVPPKLTEKDQPKGYSGPRNVDGFVKYLKDKGVSQREPNGKLGEKAGLIPDLDTSVLPDYAALASQVSKSNSKQKPVYERILSKAAEDSSYLTRESKRLQSILGGTLKPGDADNFQIKLNIVNSLLGNQNKAKDEL